MGAYPSEYNKKDFLNFLKKNNVSDVIIAKFVELPETVERSGDTFKLSINLTWYSIGNTFYNFELNYYSNDLVEYLFSSKIFTDIEVSINYLTCELLEKGYMSKEKEFET